MSPFDFATLYLAAGINVIPVRRDGTKAPDPSRLPRVWDEQACRNVPTWKPFQTEVVRQSQARDWWDVQHPPGIAAVCGAASCGLELIDLDRGSLLDPWRALVEEERPGLLDRLSLVRTPRQPSGYHAWLRCTEVRTPGNAKLAVDPAAPAKERTLIETRGEGGYALVPGCPPDCHAEGLPYRHVGGPPLWELRFVTASEREVLVRCARALTLEAPEPPAHAGPSSGGASPPGDALRPGDDFDRRGPDWSEILEPHGWACTGRRDRERRWKRPGKDAPGWSATTGHCRAKDGADLLRVFSTNAAPFEDGRAYGKFRALALLEYAGDMSATARALCRLGFGERTRPPRPVREPTAEEVAWVLRALAKADPGRLREILERALKGGGHV
jgi:hypothetical protein